MGPSEGKWRDTARAYVEHALMQSSAESPNVTGFRAVPLVAAGSASIPWG